MTTADTKPCPYCAEPINPAARKCRHCGEFLDPAAAVKRRPQETIVRETQVVDRRSKSAGEQSADVAKTAVAVGVGGCLTPIFFIGAIIVVCVIFALAVGG